jgi:hypothetical protein
MQDRPTREELIDAVRDFLETDVVPALEGTLKFHARVAANVLGIVGRELAPTTMMTHESKTEETSCVCSGRGEVTGVVRHDAHAAAALRGLMFWAISRAFGRVFRS